MTKNARLLCATRLRGLNVAYGHAMSCTPEWVVCGDSPCMLPPIFGTHGISVPISRGSPPVLNE